MNNSYFPKLRNYHIEVPTRGTVMVRVSATNREEAIEKVMSGEIDYISPHATYDISIDKRAGEVPEIIGVYDIE